MSLSAAWNDSYFKELEYFVTYYCMKNLVDTFDIANYFHKSVDPILTPITSGFIPLSHMMI